MQQKNDDAYLAVEATFVLYVTEEVNSFTVIDALLVPETTLVACGVRDVLGIGQSRSPKRIRSY